MNLQSQENKVVRCQVGKTIKGFVFVGFEFDPKGKQEENMSLRQFLRTRPRFGIQRGALEEEEEEAALGIALELEVDVWTGTAAILAGRNIREVLCGWQQ